MKKLIILFITILSILSCSLFVNISDEDWNKKWGGDIPITDPVENFDTTWDGFCWDGTNDLWD